MATLDNVPQLLRFCGCVLCGDEPQSERVARTRSDSSDRSDSSEETLSASETEDFEEAGIDSYTELFEMRKRAEHGSKKLKTTVVDWEANIKNCEHLSGDLMLRRLRGIMDSMIRRTIPGLRDDDYVRVVIRANGLKTPISIPYISVREYDIDHIFSRVEAVLQSNEHVRLDSSFFINVASTLVPNAGMGGSCGGIRNRRIPNFDRWLTKKQCFINPTFAEGWCGFAAIIIAKSLADKSNLRYDQPTKQLRQEAQILAAASRLPLYGGLDLDGIKRIQAYLKDYQITIFTPGEMESVNVLFRGEERRDKVIHLLLHNNHFYVVKSAKALYGTKYYCNLCYKAYEHSHRCSALCYFCQQPECRNTARERLVWDAECSDCGVTFKTYDCVAAHSRERCDSVALCAECGLFVPRAKLDPPSLHDCMLKYCLACRCLRPRFVSHQCYIPVAKKRDDRASSEEEEEELDEALADLLETASQASARSKEEREGETRLPIQYETAYVDFETAVTHLSRHFASILSVLQWADGEERTFEGSDSASLFVDYILSLDYRRTKRIFIAHYASGFDIFCFLDQLYKRNLKLSIISKGQKIISLSMMSGHIRFIDSLSFLPMPLAAFSKAFDIPETKKGFWPYRLLTCTENETPETLVERLKAPVPFPSREAFDEAGMMPSRKAEFDDWYPKAVDYFTVREYRPWEELLAYCKSDVTLLRLGCERFRATYKEYMEIDPFESGVTLTAANFKAFRRNYMKPDQVAIISDAGMQRGLYSQMALIWLESVARQNGIYIQHAGNEGEKKIGIYFVDGYSRELPVVTYRLQKWRDKGVVYQFNGCLFHGHPECQKDRQLKFQGESMEARYSRTTRCERYLQQQGYSVITQWSCKFERLVRINPWLTEAALASGALHPRLMPRDGYFGGRVEAFKLYHECKPEEKIRYFDFTGLYPTVMLTNEYYIGVPEIIRGPNIRDPSQYRGLVYGRFLPPRDLFLPVIPCRINRKLYFTLCNVCALTGSSRCDHEDDERAITSIVTTEELALAREHGYRVLELFEVWHYPEDQRSSTIFRGFESLWMRVKAEASGWPSGVADDDDAKNRYIQEHRTRYGIEIDPSKVRKNASNRTLAKLCGNALYGRLGLRQERPNVLVATQYDDLLRLLKDKNNEVTDIYTVNEQVSFVTYKRKQNTETLESINLVMCIQTTSLARCMLYKAMDAIHRSAGCKVLYCDTDSVLFAGPDAFEAPFSTGEVLGDLKDEILGDYGPDAWISHFVCSGAKSYSYIVRTPKGEKSVMKLKGFRLDYNTRQLLSPDLMVRLVKEQSGESVEIACPRRVVRSMRTGTMKETGTKKRYRVTADKRILLLDEDYVTVPFGFT